MSPHLGLLVVVLLWGANFTVTKLALPELPPLPFTALRFGAASVLLWVVLARREGAKLPPRDLWGPLLALGLVGNTLYQLVFMHGLHRTTATNSALILASMPTVVTVAAGLLGLDRTSRRQRVALAIATAGVVLVVASRGLDFGAAGIGDLMMLAAVACWATYTLGLRRLGGRLSSLGVTTWTTITGTPVLLLAGLPGLARLDWGGVSAVAWGGLAYSGIFSLVVAYLLWNRGVQRIGPSRAALYTCLTPLVATTVAMLGLGERPGLPHIAGGALIVSGVLLTVLPNLRRTSS